MDNTDLLLKSYDYQLPSELIADRPRDRRDDSLLLAYRKDKQQLVDSTFKNLASFVPENALLVTNSSKVFPCRLFANKQTGGKAEFFFLDLNPKNGSFLAMIKTSSAKKSGDQFIFENLIIEITELVGNGTFYVSISTIETKDDLEKFLFEKGAVPIPPYIRGGVSDEEDRDRYQTIYAENVGSVAAPTAGLHFTEDVFDSLKQKGIDHANVTLHVGLGTFSPVKVADLTDHEMHSEQYFIDDENLKVLAQAYKDNRPVVAVGTTSLRVLESCYHSIISNNFKANKIHETNIFLHPGKEVHSISGLVTNFHLPESTLLMLVATLVGRQEILRIYEHAKDKNYRFFSYGDAMYLDLR